MQMKIFGGGGRIQGMTLQTYCIGMSPITPTTHLKHTKNTGYTNNT